MAAYWFSPTEIINFNEKEKIKYKEVYFQLTVPVAAERDLIAFCVGLENLISSFRVFFVLFSFRGSDGSILMIDIHILLFFLKMETGVRDQRLLCGGALLNRPGDGPRLLGT